MERVAIKNEAKRLLQGRWANAVGAVFIFFVLAEIVNYISYIIPILGIIIGIAIISYFSLSFNKYCVKVSENIGRIKYSECFLDASTFFKTIGAELLVGLALIIPFIIISIILIVISPELEGIFFILFLIVIILTCIFTVYISLSFFPLAFIFIEEKEIGIIEGIKKSMNISKGVKWEYFVFLLSFIGWYLLAIITCGIGLLWLTPYYMLSTYLFYKEAKKRSYQKTE